MCEGKFYILNRQEDPVSGPFDTWGQAVAGLPAFDTWEQAAALDSTPAKYKGAEKGFYPSIIAP